MVKSKLYSTSEIADIVGVSTPTIVDWEKKNLIPQARREGLHRRRRWIQPKVEQILIFAKDNGFRVPTTLEGVAK